MRSNCKSSNIRRRITGSESRKYIAHHLRVLSEHDTALRNRGITSQYLLLWKLHLKDVIATWEQRRQMSDVDYALQVLQLRRGMDHLLSRSPPEAEENLFPIL